jgi:hypothetical protein
MVKGRSFIITANMFIQENPDGTPATSKHLKQDEIEWLVRGENERTAHVKRRSEITDEEWTNKKAPPVAIPTHVATMGLVTGRDGPLWMFAYVLPNKSDVPTKKGDILTWLKKHRTSVDAVEKYFNEDFFRDLKVTLTDPQTGVKRSIRRKLEADAKSYLPMFETKFAVNLEKLAEEEPVIASEDPGPMMPSPALPW